MTSRGRHCLAASVLLASTVGATGTACGGGGAGNSTAQPRVPATPRTVAPRSPHASTTTTAIAPTVAPTPADGVAPPELVDRGTDYVAIAGSLLLYGRWLVGYHPDPALVDRAYHAGSPPGRVVSRAVTRLRRMGSHLVEVDRAPFEFAVVSATENVVSFRLTEHLAYRELVAASGRVVARDSARTEHYVISILRFASDAPWRLNLVEEQPPSVEVQL